jgi:hypothetical protein
VVTVLDTPPELRSRARVRVRYEDGVLTGTEKDVATRSIVAALTGPAAGLVQQPTVATSRPPVRILRDPEVGDDVEWTQSGTAIWKLVRLEAQIATIKTVLMGTPQTAQAPVSELVLAQEQPREQVGHLAGLSDTRDARRAPAPTVPASSLLAPIKPRRELDQLLDDVLFTQRCVEQYTRRSGGGPGGLDALDRLRSELRLRGYLIDPPQGHGNEYRRIRVDGRFDVILRQRPTPEQPITIDTLYFPAARNRVARTTARQPRPGSDGSRRSNANRRRHSR